MGKITKTAIVETYLESHPNATETQIFEEMKKGKLTISINYIRKIASIWRKKTRSLKWQNNRKPPKDDDIELDTELSNIMKIMLAYKKKGVSVSFREVHDYLKYKGTITLEAEEQKLAVKKLSNKDLLTLILGDQNSEDES